MNIFDKLNSKLNRSKYYPCLDLSKNKMTIRKGSDISDSNRYMKRFECMVTASGLILGFPTESKAAKCLSEIQSKYNLEAVKYVTDKILIEEIYNQYNN